jgi:hypothetical protein
LEFYTNDQTSTVGFINLYLFYQIPSLTPSLVSPNFVADVIYNPRSGPLKFNSTISLPSGGGGSGSSFADSYRGKTVIVKFNVYYTAFTDPPTGLQTLVNVTLNFPLTEIEIINSSPGRGGGGGGVRGGGGGGRRPMIAGDSSVSSGQFALWFLFALLILGMGVLCVF